MERNPAEMTIEELDIFAMGWIDPEAIKSIPGPYDHNFVVWIVSQCGYTSFPDEFTPIWERLCAHKDQQTTNDQYGWKAFPL